MIHILLATATIALQLGLAATAITGLIALVIDTVRNRA